ncbi:MAG: FAD-dependent oxidoreductase [Candidatus Bathyarchaeota archaeon]|nr:FAD-dependent oxidoreductase [Candidatus Bathyarchaeota archaeon]
MKIIIGAGLSGLSAAYHLGRDYRILERDGVVGGLCRSVSAKGYTFDLAPHIFFTGSQYVNGLVNELLNGDLIRQRRRAYIYTRGTYVEYPFEVNLHGLPQEVIDECIEGARHRPNIQPKNFMEWITATMGEGVAKHYMVPYNEKIWKYPLEDMNIDWVAGRVPAPSVEEMVKGAQGKVEREYGPNAYFLYPRVGGIGAIPNALSTRVKDISLNSDVSEIHTKGKRLEVIYTRNGESKRQEADRVLSSVPLPELIKMIKSAPEDVIKASENLIYNSLACFNIGVNREAISDKHWLYFPDKEYPFNRISFPMNLSPETVPKGKSSIVVEVTYRGAKPDAEETKEKVRAGLVNAEILRDDDGLEVFDALDFKYAYVVYDLHHQRNVNLIQTYLKSLGVSSMGRFGEWEYLNMDKAILSGKRAAEEEAKK